MRQTLANAALVALSIAVPLLAMEAVFRWVDGYRFDSLRLAAAVTNQVQSADATLADAKARTFAKGFDSTWYSADPPDYDRSPNFSPPADWDEAVRNYRSAVGREDYSETEFKFLYNDKWLEEACATGKHNNVLGVFRKYPGFVYSFASPDGSTKPEYRVVPRGWDSRVTYYNNFGFRGPDIVPRKPDRAIRIAFLGASVTANGWPYTYPEYAVSFLRQWARANHIDVDFDVINAARGGINSATIAQIYRYEVAPLRPDIVVYYEGGNDLYTSSLVRDAEGKPFVRQDPARLQAALTPAYLPLERHSALLRRLYELVRHQEVGMAEPAKPPHALAFDLTQKDPDLSREDLPFKLDRQIADLRRMAGDAKSAGAEFAVASFVAMVHSGLRLDPDRHRYILSVLNVEYAPLTYAEIRAAVDFENGVYRKLARQEHWDFLDVDRHYPQNPDYFADMVHFWGTGAFRLQGWIMAQLLAPLILDAVSSGRLPRPGVAPDPGSIAWPSAPPKRFDLGCLPDKSPS